MIISNGIAQPLPSIAVGVQDDKVIIDLGAGARGGILLSASQAEQLSDAMSDAAHLAILSPKTSPPPTKGWGCQVIGQGDKIGLKFFSPEPGHPRIVPLPAQTAIHFAGKLRWLAGRITSKQRNQEPLEIVNPKEGINGL